MKLFIAINLIAVFVATAAYAIEAPRSDVASGHSAVAVVKLFSNEERNAAIAEIEKRFPLEKWKTVGFCGYQKEPVVLMKVPPFLKWDSECNLHHFEKGIEFCGPSESSPRLSGTFEFNGHKRVLQVGLEAVHSKVPLVARYSLTVFDGTWKSAGALRGVKEIKLGRYPAFQADIEDHTGELSKPTKSLTLIKFAGRWVGGMLYFIETEARPKGDVYIWHDEWIFQKIVDQVISSFEYKVKVE